MIKVHTIPCFEDNYGYLLENTETGNATLIDVPDGGRLLHVAKSLGLNLKYVLFTHHHWDHIDGFEAIKHLGLTVIGAKDDAYRLPTLDFEVSANSTIELDGLRINVIATHGHTIGQVAYHFIEHDILFSADSLMTWGCGRLSEGTHAQAFDTLERLATLPENTLIYSGHNYGKMGGKFAMSLGGDLDAMETRMKKINAKNDAEEPIVPVLLSEEKRTNPFLKCHDENYAKQLKIESLSPLKRFTHIRNLRDKF